MARATESRAGRLAPALAGLATIVVLLALWQGAVDIGWVSPFVAPAPSRPLPSLLGNAPDAP